MSVPRTGEWISDQVVAYAAAHSTPPDPVVEWITAETAARTGSRAAMQIGSDQSSFLSLVTAAIGVTCAVEIGTFTGTSSVAIARGLAAGGRLTCFDLSEEWTSIAVDAWRRSGLDDRIELVLGDALTNLTEFLPGKVVDLAFIDADKVNYANYYELVLPALRPGGLILVDNTIWYGKVIDPTVTDADTAALRAFNAARADDDRVEVALLTIGDGVTMLRKR